MKWKFGEDWNKTRVYTIARNATYAGWRPGSFGEKWEHGSWPAIVTVETFRMVNDGVPPYVERRRRTKSLRRHCGASMSAEASRDALRRPEAPIITVRIIVHRRIGLAGVAALLGSNPPLIPPCAPHTLRVGGI